MKLHQSIQCARKQRTGRILEQATLRVVFYLLFQKGFGAAVTKVSGETTIHFALWHKFNECSLQFIKSGYFFAGLYPVILVNQCFFFLVNWFKKLIHTTKLKKQLALGFQTFIEWTLQYWFRIHHINPRWPACIISVIFILRSFLIYSCYNRSEIILSSS